MDKFIKISERGSTVRAEIVGGITTFFAMAYIIFVNPGLLSQTGMEFNAVLLATCISAAVGTFLTALLANAPFAQAPGMGLNAFFTYTICFGMGYTWQQGLAIVLLSGILFLVVAVSPLRKNIISAIPAFLKNAISAGIGLFIAFIGLLNVSLISFSGGVPALQFALVGEDGLKVMNSAGLLTLIGLLITAILLAYKVKGAMFIGIILTTLIGVPMGVTQYVPQDFSFSVLRGVELLAGRSLLWGEEPGMIPLAESLIGSSVGTLPFLNGIQLLCRQVLFEVLRDECSELEQLYSRFVRYAALTDYLHRNPRFHISVAEMARVMNMGELSFARRFSADTGISPRKFFERILAEHAVRLLTGTDMSVKEIAGEMGVDNEYYFSRFFKRHLGLPPGEFRQRMTRMV